MNSQSSPNHLRTYWFTCLVGIWIAAGIVIAFAMPSAQELVATPVAFFHIPMAVTTVVAFMLAAWHGAAWLRRRQARSDAMSLAYAEIGAICGLIATAS